MGFVLFSALSPADGGSYPMKTGISFVVKGVKDFALACILQKAVRKYISPTGAFAGGDNLDSSESVTPVVRKTGLFFLGCLGPCVRDGCEMY
jgi:hypothetical protein